MKKLVFVLVLVLGFSVSAFAGRDGNAGANASATALVSCFQVDGPPFQATFEADIWVGGGIDDHFPSGCIDGCSYFQPCVECLNNLQELGLSIVDTECAPFNAVTGISGVGGYSLFDFSNTNGTLIPAGFQVTPTEVCNYTLTGNGTPLADRLPDCS